MFLQREGSASKDSSRGYNSAYTYTGNPMSIFFLALPQPFVWNIMKFQVEPKLLRTHYKLLIQPAQNPKLEPPAHNTGCCVIGLTYSSGTFVSFFVFTAGCKASGPPGPPLHSPWNPWNIQLSQGTGQGVSMTFNAASRLRLLEDEVRRWGHVAANCRVCKVSPNLQSCHTPLGLAASAGGS